MDAVKLTHLLLAMFGVLDGLDFSHLDGGEN